VDVFLLLDLLSILLNTARIARLAGLSCKFVKSLYPKVLLISTTHSAGADAPGNGHEMGTFRNVMFEVTMSLEIRFYSTTIHLIIALVSFQREELEESDGE